MKFILALFALSLTFCLPALEVGFKYDLISDYQISADYFRDYVQHDYKLEYDKHKYSFYAQLPYKVNDNFYIGPGVQFQMPRTAHLTQYEFSNYPPYEYTEWSYRWHEYSFIPVYLNNRISAPIKDLSLDFTYNIGYNFLLSGTTPSYIYDTQGGFYYSFGLGVNYRQLCLAVLYEENNGKYISEAHDYKILNRQIGLSAGVRVQKNTK